MARRSNAKPSAPLWYPQLTWSIPISVAILRSRMREQNPIPSRPGCYAFTSTPGPLVPGQVLYVGKAIDLKTRIRGYLVDYMETAATKHKGRAFIFEYRDRHTNARIYVRWAIYGDPTGLEGGLIDYLEPQMNDRIEEVELADDERLDPKLLP